MSQVLSNLNIPCQQSITCLFLFTLRSKFETYSALIHFGGISVSSSASICQFQMAHGLVLLKNKFNTKSKISRSDLGLVIVCLCIDCLLCLLLEKQGSILKLCARFICKRSV